MANLIIGLDYWQVCSHYPDYFRQLAQMHIDAGDEVHIISAVGRLKAGSVAPSVEELQIPNTSVCEVQFKNPAHSPQLKLEKCKELGVTVFYDDRSDVCELLADNGILTMQVARKERTSTDVSAEQN